MPSKDCAGTRVPRKTKVPPKISADEETGLWASVSMELQWLEASETQCRGSGLQAAVDQPTRFAFFGPDKSGWSSKQAGFGDPTTIREDPRYSRVNSVALG